jgi:hypothetical protein
MINIKEASIIWFQKFFQPIHFYFFEKSRAINNIIPAKNCLIPATNQGGIVSTAILIPKKVVPQNKATITSERTSLGFLNIKERNH